MSRPGCIVMPIHFIADTHHGTEMAPDRTLA